MDFRQCVRSSLISLILFLSVTGDQHACPDGTYRDTVTGRCDSCEDLCQSAHIQGTQEECNLKCPGVSQNGQDYNKPTQPANHSQPCPPGQYYDPVLYHCDLCARICTDHEIQGTTEDCKEKCPAEYKEDKETIRKSVLSEEVNVPIRPGPIAVVTVLSVLAVVLVVLILFRNKLPGSVQQRIPCLQQPNNPAEMSPEENPLRVSPSSSEEYVSIPVEETQPEGFTDLRSGRLCSMSSNDT